MSLKIFSHQRGITQYQGQKKKSGWKYGPEICVLTREKRKRVDTSLNVHVEAGSKSGADWVGSWYKMELCVGV